MTVLSTLLLPGINLNSLIQEQKAKKSGALVYKDLRVSNRIYHNIYIHCRD